MSNITASGKWKWQQGLANALLILICVIMLFPVVTTITISFKREQDVVRKPPIFFPCDTPERGFDITQCRWAVEGYQRVLAPKPLEGWLPFALTGNLVRIYVPNTLLYASVSSVLVVLLAGMAGYALSRYNFRGRSALMV